MERTIRLLDVRLRVRCDEPKLLEPFFAVFCGTDAADASAPGGTEVLAEVDASRSRFSSGGRTVDLAPWPLAPAHVYNLLHRTLVRAAEHAYLLHAAVVEAPGGALLIGGPSGVGKTSLALALSARGFPLLGDDVAPLSARDRRVHPFPRRVGILRHEASPADLVDATRLGDKAFVDAGSVGAVGQSGPLPLAAVVLLNPYVDDGREEIRMRVGIAPGPAAEELIQGLEQLPRVEVAVERIPGRLALATLHLRGAAAFAAVDRELGRGDAAVVFHERDYGPEKRYAPEPRLEGISTREAAVELLRETLNRDSQSKLMQRHGGSVPACLFELSGLLAGATCYRLTPGGIEATADLLCRELGR